MSKLPPDSYVDLVRRSGLIEPERLDRVLEAIDTKIGGGPQDSMVLAKALVEARLVTNWQNKMIMKGLWRGFFLGRYKLLKELGAGGMSSVYMGEHTLLRRRVAIKVLHQKRATNRSHLTRFYRESRSTAALDHPNIIRVYDFDTDGKFHYLVMEYVDGPTLQDLVDKRGPLSIEKAVSYISQTAFGLSYAHEKGLIHRDIKPANILIGPQGIAKILDLGLARLNNAAGPSLTVDDGSVLGTVDYLAPEQAMDSHNVDPRVDVYSLGCTMYFTLTGQPPFPSGTMAVRLMKHQTQEPKPITEFRNDLPPAIEELCRAMMAKQTANRPSAMEAYELFQNWMMDHHQRMYVPSVLDMPTQAGPGESSRDTIHGLQSPSTIIGATLARSVMAASMAAEDDEQAAGPLDAGEEDRAAAGDSDSLSDDVIGAGLRAAAELETPLPTETPVPQTPAAEARPQKIPVRCGECNTLLYAPQVAAGRKVRCPACSCFLKVPVSPGSGDATPAKPKEPAANPGLSFPGFGLPGS